MFSRMLQIAIGTAVVATVSCGPDSRPEVVPSDSASIGVEGAPVTPSPVCGDHSKLLPTPFTAKQIRDEWVPGLRLVLRRWTPAGEAFERWLVVAADREGVDIEFAAVGADGNEIDEPTTRHSSWMELRDHASYPVADASRSREMRTTRLGELSGWRYTVRDSSEGTVSELFFADSLPGAPIQMTVRRNGQVVLELEQIDREGAGTTAQD